MRQFVIVSHTATTKPIFSLNDLPGEAGRMDILCRCVGASFLISHSLRTEVRVYLVLQNKVTIRFEGTELRHVRPDERCIAALIKKALQKAENAVGHIELESTPGIYISKMGLNPLLNSISPSGTVIHLHENGISSQKSELPLNPIFVLSDHHNFLPSEIDILNQYSQKTINIGPMVIHTDHAITIVHNLLDIQNNHS